MEAAAPNATQVTIEKAGARAYAIEYERVVQAIANSFKKDEKRLKHLASRCAAEKVKDEKTKERFKTTVCKVFDAATDIDELSLKKVTKKLKIARVWKKNANNPAIWYSNEVIVYACLTTKVCVEFCGSLEEFTSIRTHELEIARFYVLFLEVDITDPGASIPGNRVARRMNSGVYELYHDQLHGANARPDEDTNEKWICKYLTDIKTALLDEDGECINTTEVDDNGNHKPTIKKTR